MINNRNRNLIEKRKNGRKFLLGTVALLVFLSLLLSGCSLTDLFSLEELDLGKDPSSSSEEDTPFSGMNVAFYTGEELDPFSSRYSINRALLSLCYEDLVTLDRELNAVSSLAEISVEDSRVTFFLKEEASFSDGSRVTAEDCVYSFRRASFEDSVWFPRFEKIISFTAESKYVFTVSFSENSRFSVNLLTIPIVKSGGKVNGVYVGSGRYVLSHEDGELCLRGRTDGRYTDPYAFTRIGLYRVEDTDEMTYLLNYGKVLASPVDLSADSIRYKGQVELISFPTLKMNFIALNFGKPYLEDPEVSRAISMALDRTGAVKKLYRGAAVPTWQPFSPAWNKTIESGIGADIYSTSEAGELLNEAGLTYRGAFRCWKGEKVTLTILCSGSIISREIAEWLSESLHNVGFDTSIVSHTGTEYEKAIEKGDFDLYIGETVIAPDMDISFLLAEDFCHTARVFSVDENGLTSLDVLSSNLEAFYSGNGDMRNVISAFTECQPFIPLWYTNGALAVNRIVNGDFVPGQYDVYAGIESWCTD